MAGRSLRADERGSITAEFAITVPAVLVVLAVIVGGVQLAGQQAGLTALAGDLARLEARGDSALAAARLRSFGGQPVVERHETGGVLCVTARASPRSGLLAAVTVTASGCAAISEPTEWVE